MSSCPNPNRCLFTGCGGDCEPPRQAAAVSHLGRMVATVAPRRLDCPAPLEAPHRTRNALAHRKLLVAALP